MWFGHIVPFLQFPVADRRSPFHSPTEEERTLPLPMDLCTGIATESGTALYVKYGINIDSQKWGDDLAGWFVIAPFPPKLFGTKQLIHVGVRLRNHPGAFHKAVAEPVAENRGFFLAMEVMATGDMGALILMPESKQHAFETQLGSILRDGKALDAIEERSWASASNEKSLDSKQQQSKYQLKDWTNQLFKGDNGIKWGEEDRRVLVRERQITIPYGDFWYRHGKERKEEAERKGDKKYFEKIIRPNYCLVARDMDTPVLLVLVPSRPLFRINMDIAVQSKDDSSRIGVLNDVVELLDENKINIWHSQHTFRSLAFISESHASENIANPEKEEKLRAMESRLSIVASVPEERQHDSPEAIKSYLKELRQSFLSLRRKPASETLEKIKALLESMPEAIVEEFSKQRSEELNSDNKEDWENFDLRAPTIKRFLKKTKISIFKKFLTT